MNEFELPEELKCDILLVAKGLGARQICEGIHDLIVRERHLLLSKSLDEEQQAIVQHGLAVLVAAAAGYEQAANDFERQLEAATTVRPGTGQSHG
jgi:hypothetical protein